MRICYNSITGMGLPQTYVYVENPLLFEIRYIPIAVYEEQNLTFKLKSQK